MDRLAAGITALFWLDRLAFGWTYAVGDQAMQAENDDGEDGSDGDLGFIRHVDPERSEMVADFEGREVVHDAGAPDESVRLRDVLGSFSAG